MLTTASSILKMMKHLLFISFLCFSGFLAAQNGFKLIEKAEKKIEKKNYAQAMKLLEKADSASYGFCGNAWMDARYAITLNKLKIYDVRNDVGSAVKLLNQPLVYWDLDEDSLRMIYFIRLFGKEVIKREFDSIINSYIYYERFFKQELFVHFSFFEDPYPLSTFLINRIEMYVKQKMNTDKYTPKDEILRHVFREQPFYLLLTD